MRIQREIAGSEPSRPARPSTPIFESIPTILKLLRRWLPWRYSPRPNESGRFGKVPFGISDRRANYTDPKTWLPFEAVVQQYFRGEYDGIGLVLGNGLCGLDEDHCITGGLILPEAERHIGHLRSYAESSLSDGIHCLAFGTLPSGRRKRGNHEIYCDRRFFVVTGRHLQGAPHVVADREQELHEVHKMIFGSGNEVPNEDCASGGHSRLSGTEIRTAPEPLASPVLGSVPKNRPNTQGEGGRREGEEREEEKGCESVDRRVDDARVVALLRRDPVAARLYFSGCAGGQNSSEADFALASKLVFYTNRNQEQMERLFRGSALGQRPKATSQRGAGDYVTLTLQRACACQDLVRRVGQTAGSSTPRSRGRPRSAASPGGVAASRNAGTSWRVVAKQFGIGTATAMRVSASITPLEANDVLV